MDALNTKATVNTSRSNIKHAVSADAAGTDSRHNVPKTKSNIKNDRVMAPGSTEDDETWSSRAFTKFLCLNTSEVDEDGKALTIIGNSLPEFIRR